MEHLGTVALLQWMIYHELPCCCGRLDVLIALDGLLGFIRCQYGRCVSLFDL